MDQASNLRQLAVQKKKKITLVSTSVKKERTTRIIAVASGKGGVGKTNLAINMGILFAKEGKKVIVMDADLGLANVNIILGIIPKYNLYHVLKGQKKLSEIMIDTPQGIKIIAGASGFAKLADMGDDQRNVFIENLEDLSEADIVIIDTGAGVSRNVLSFVMAADEAIIVTTPEPTSITDAYGIIKSMSAESSQVDIKLVVNRVRDIGEARQVSDRVINIAGQFLNMKVENLGFVYEDEIVSKSVIRQKPFVMVSSRNRASICVDHLVKRLLNIQVEEKTGGMKKFMKNFFSFYKNEE